MATERDWGKAVAKLVDKTNSNEIIWIENPKLERENLVGTAYTGGAYGRGLAVYEYKYRYYTDAEEYEWREAVAIEFVRPGGAPEWKWPELPVSWQLLDAVRAQVARAGEFYDALVRE